MFLFTNICSLSTYKSLHRFINGKFSVNEESEGTQLRSGSIGELLCGRSHTRWQSYNLICVLSANAATFTLSVRSRRLPPLAAERLKLHDLLHVFELKIILQIMQPEFIENSYELYDIIDSHWIFKKGRSFASVLYDVSSFYELKSITVWFGTDIWWNVLVKWVFQLKYILIRNKIWIYTQSGLEYSERKIYAGFFPSDEFKKKREWKVRLVCNKQKSS